MHFVQIWKRGPHFLDEINDRPPLDMFWQFFFNYKNAVKRLSKISG